MNTGYYFWSQVPIDSVSKTDEGDPVCPPVPIYTFCHQISGTEFEQQKLESSQKAMEELLEILLTDQNMSEKDRRKKLKQVSTAACWDSDHFSPSIKVKLLHHKV